MITTGYRKRVTFLLFTLLLIRFWLGQTFELTPQEAYAWLKGKHLDWGYWDQGPLIPFLSWVGTYFFGQTELGVRWLASVIYCSSGFLLFFTTRQWFSPRAGFYAALLYLVLPLSFWQMLLLSEATASVGLMILALLSYRYVIERGRWYDWLGAGVLSAGAITVSWWNVLWPAGLLFFLLVDRQRQGRWLHRTSLLFILLSLCGFLPFALWHHHIGLPAGILPSALHWLEAKQHLTGHGALAFLRDQFIWLGFGGLLGLGVILIHARDYAFLRRPHLFLLCLSIPGIVLQCGLSLFGIHNQDVMAALYLPLLSLAGSVGTRITDADRRWRFAALAVILIAFVQTISGLIPAAATHFWSGYAPEFRPRNRPLAIEIDRLQRDSGSNFVIVDDPREASALSFYLPLQPFVYVAPTGSVRNQFDLWPSYFDFEVSNALLMTREVGPAGEVIREFEHVQPLPDIPIPAAAKWHFFLCERYKGARSEAGREP